MRHKEKRVTCRHGMRWAKKATAWVLTATMLLTLPTTLPQASIHAHAEGGDISTQLTDLVQVKIGDKTETMKLYNKGVYECAVELEKGETEAKLLINGEEVSGATDTVNLTEDKKVYFRLAKGNFTDSEDNDFVKSAALVGNFNGLEFVNTDDRADVELVSVTSSQAKAEDDTPENVNASLAPADAEEIIEEGDIEEASESVDIKEASEDVDSENTDIEKTVEDENTEEFIETENIEEVDENTALMAEGVTSDESKRYDIAAWNPADKNAELDYLGGGLFQRTFYFKELAEELEIADGGYKAAANDGWDVSWGDGDGNVALTIPAGTSEMTVFVDTVNGVVYDSIRSEANKVTGDEYKLEPFKGTVSLIGTVRGGNDDWTPEKKGYEFTQITDSLYIYQDLYSGSSEYKTVFDYSKWADGDNNKLSVTADNTYVIFLFDAKESKVYDSIKDTDKIGELLGMETTPPENKVVYNGNDTVQFVCAAGKEAKSVFLVYGVYNGTEIKDEQKVLLQGKSNGTFTSDNLYFGDDEANIAYYYVIDDKDVLDTKNEDKLNINGKEYSSYTKSKFSGRKVSMPGTVNGNGWNPSRESEMMEYKGNGKYELTVKDVGPANYEYKIAIDGSWDENYGKDGIEHGANISLVVSKTQDVKFTYNDISHLVVNSVDYIFADVTLTGKAVPGGSIDLTDELLRGIYSASLDLKAGTYGDFVCHYDGKNYPISEFTLKNDKTVNFYFDPVTEICYSDASDEQVNTDYIKYDSKDSNFKSPFGAVKTDHDVTFGIETGTDAEKVQLVVKKVGKYNLKKKGKASDGVQKWERTVSFSKIGEYDYFFVIYNAGGAISVYADDTSMDYGTGIATDLLHATPYDLVVYDKNFATPDWMKNAVIYQIFPDRFYDGDTSNNLAQQSSRGATDYEFVSDWSMYPENPEQEEMEENTYPEQAFKGDGNWSNEIYGGDVQGIIKRMDYLKALGVTVIYLNPVCSSISSHRYDASDYEKLDPILGDMGDFEELTKAAEQNGMNVVLDGVFNHVADDSKYFDRYYKFLEAGTQKLGAYPYWAYVFDAMAADKNLTQAQAEVQATEYFKKNFGITDFTYTKWFDFTGEFMKDDNGKEVTDTIGLRKGKGVYAYDCWWGYDSMPVIIATNGSEYQTPGWADEIIGKDTGALDGSVTKFWLDKGSDGWRLDVANEVSDETWQHFRKSVKSLDKDNVIIGEIWGDAVNYLLGDMYDSVMNYMFRGAVINYVRDSKLNEAEISLERLRERYPEEAWYAMMNLVDSHDTTRILSYLDGIDDDRNQKDTASAFPTYASTSDRAKQLQYVVAFIQMTYAGAPTIYYGDEIGMVGADDPDDRRGMAWGEGNKELVEWYATMAKLRSSYTALRTGSVTPFNVDDNVMAYVRSDKAATLAVMANNTDTDITKEVDFASLGMNDGEYKDLVNGNAVTVSGGKGSVTIPAYRGSVIVEAEKAVNITIDAEALKPAYDSSSKVSSEGRAIAEKITISEAAKTMKAGETAQLKVMVTPADAVDKKGSWRSSDETVATVDANGNVKAVSAGTAEISASICNGQKAVCKVTVTGQTQTPEPLPPQPPVSDVKVTKITISGMSKKIAAGKSIQLTAKVTPDNADNKAVTWKSSNTKYATVNSKGKVTTKKAGKGHSVTITATANDGSNKKATYKISIVKDKVKSIKLKASTKSVKAGSKVTVKATVKTSGKTANKTLSWSSSNKKYATVSKKGVVTTKKAGKGKKVKITAKATDGTGKKATITIKIK